jgi:PPK2 family polyphosphate:nucleotide phosphotransferase
MDIKDAAALKTFVKRFRVEPGRKVELKQDYDPRDTAGMAKPENVDDVLNRAVEFMAEHQDKLYAESKRGLLIILQAMDAAGKDGVIKHVMSGLNPQGCQVYSFKAPSAEELDHDYMWRNFKALPERGRIGIFNRSYYEEVLVVRVHPGILQGQSLPEDLIDDGIWQRRFAQINNFEQYLVENGIDVIKIFLNVSKEEQRQRLLARIETPEKQWKVSAGDAKERQYWDKYQACFNDVFSHTSTARAPWYVVPADHKWFARIVTAAIVAEKLIEMNPQYPAVTDAIKAEIEEARRILESESDAAKPRADTPAKGSGNGGKQKKHKDKVAKADGKTKAAKHSNGQQSGASVVIAPVAAGQAIGSVAVASADGAADAAKDDKKKKKKDKKGKG